MTCNIHKGDKPVDITWLHNNETITSINGVSLLRVNKKISTLSIDSVHAEHSGIYSCVAKNAAGTSSYSAHLLVNGTYRQENKWIDSSQFSFQLKILARKL